MRNRPLPSLDAVLDSAALDTRSHLGRVVMAEAARMRDVTTEALESREVAGRFEAALRDARQRLGGGIIAEYKRASPSLGPFAGDVDFDRQLAAYREGGATCVSVLAEPLLFEGSVADVTRAGHCGLPRLYKGFVLGEAHLAEAQASGAEAVLLIARVLKDFTPAFAEAAREAGLEPLIELHDLSEVAYAAPARAGLIGINARDLASFAIGSPSAEPLRAAFGDAVLIRESGLATPDEIKAAFAQGFDAVLIGEALMRSDDPRGFLAASRA